MLSQFEYIPIDHFALKWRFAEDAAKWTVLPASDLERLRPLSPACARSLWEHCVLPALKFGAIGAASSGSASRIAEFRPDDSWGVAEETSRIASFLVEHIHAPPDTPLTFFWSSTLAVRATWDLLLRYPTDFCYPSDETVGVLDASDTLVFFRDELWWLAR